jgi:RNA polymerase sigma-70 factor (ECF subfamily)
MSRSQPEKTALKMATSSANPAGYPKPYPVSARAKRSAGLKFYGGLSNRQIAKMSGLSESNVGVILYRAMHRLRETLGEADLTGVENTGYERA